MDQANDMSGTSRRHDRGDDSRTTGPIAPARSNPLRDRRRGRDPPELRLTVVRHDGIADRATVHPPGLTGIDRMETWLSVNRSAVVDLDAWR